MSLVQTIIHLSHGLLEWSPVTLASSSFPYSPFSTQKREGSFKAHVSDHVMALLKTTGRLTIKGNAACEARMDQALPTSLVSLWPPYSWISPNPSPPGSAAILNVWSSCIRDFIQFNCHLLSTSLAPEPKASAL